MAGNLEPLASVGSKGSCRREGGWSRVRLLGMEALTAVEEGTAGGWRWAGGGWEAAPGNRDLVPMP